MWESSTTREPVSPLSTLAAPKPVTWLDRYLFEAHTSSPWERLLSIDIVPASANNQNCREFQSVHVDPITVYYIAVSWGQEDNPILLLPSTQA